MSKTEIVNNVTRTFGRLGLKLQKYSPEILAVAGIAGGVVATVMACKATTKLSAVVDKTKEQVAMVHQGIEDGEVVSIVDGEEQIVPYNEEDGKKDLTVYYAKGGLEVVKLYAPAVLLGVASVTCILVSNGIMRKRNLALAAAYMGEHTAFKEYRGRVIERLGKEMDRELKYNIKSKEVEVKTVDEETGEVKTEKKVVEVIDSTCVDRSPYAIVFDCGNAGWVNDAEANKFFLVQQQRFANDLLKTRGHVFLNEVYDMLGAKRTRAGAVMGWFYDKEGKYSDNYIDFGIFDIHNEKACDFVNGIEKSIILDFNVDGRIDHLL